MEQPTVTLATLANGAAAELFEEELQKVLKNIADPNTDHKAAREIGLRLKIVPNEDRNVGEVTLTCSSKLAPFRKVQTVLYMGRRGGKLAAVEHNPKQVQLFDDKPNVSAIDGGRKD